MQVEEILYHDVPTVAIMPRRHHTSIWPWEMRALKLFPDSTLSWHLHVVDGGGGRAKALFFKDTAEALAVADLYNQGLRDAVRAAGRPIELIESLTLKAEKIITAKRRIIDEEELMLTEALRRHASMPRPSAEELKLPTACESFREELWNELCQVPYLTLVALRRFNVVMRRRDDMKWVESHLSPKAGRICFKERIARGYGLSGADHWGRTKASIREMLLPRANKLLQQASVVKLLADALARGTRVLVMGGFVFWYEEDGSPGWIVKSVGGESAGEEGNTLWFEGTILSKNHGRIVVLPYIKENGKTVQGHTKNGPHDGKAIPRHRDQYVTLPFEVLKGDLMFGLFGELHYE